MRARFDADLKLAMKSGDKQRVHTIRLIIAALKDREIEARGSGKTLGEDELMALLQKMIKSRQESADIYEKAGRSELAAGEKAEIAIISDYLPTQLDEAQMKKAIAEAILETQATSMKDMGKVVAILKSKYAGQMDFAKASGLVKTALN